MRRPTRSLSQRFAFLGSPRLAPLFFVLVSTLFLGDAVLSDGAYVLRDVLTFHHPWQVAVRDSIQAGRPPLWNHLNFCGTPLMANLQAGVFYPPHWLGWVLPFDRALTAEMILHLSLAGILLHRFLRRAGVNGGGALLGGIGFAYGTWTLSYLEFPMKLGSAIWLPLLWNGVWDAMREGRRRGVAWAALALTLSTFAGYPQLVLLQVLSAGVLALALVPRVLGNGALPIGAKVRRLFALPMALLVAGITCGVQLIPSWEMISYSAKVASYPPEVAMSRSLPFQGLAGIFDPFFLGLPGVDRYWGGETAEFCFGSFYVGALLLPLGAAAGIAGTAALRDFLDVKGRRRRRLDQKKVVSAISPSAPKPVERDPHVGGGLALLLFLGIGALLGILLALGRHTPIYPFLYSTVPGFAGMRWPSTAGFLVAAHLAALAGVGFDAAFRSGSVPRGLAKLATGLGILLVVLSLLGRGPLAGAFRTIQTAGSYPMHQAAYDAARGEWAQSLLLRGALVLIAGLGGIFLPRRPRLVAGIWIAIVAMDLFVASRALDTPVARGFYDETPAAVASMRDELQGHRIYTPHSTDQVGNLLSGGRNTVFFEWAKRMMLCNANIPFGVAQAQGCDPLSPRRHDAFVQAFDQESTPWEMKERIFDLWDASVLLTAEGVSMDELVRLRDSGRGVGVRRHEPRLGRSTLLTGWSTAATGDEVLPALFAADHDPLNTVILEAAPGERPPSLPARASAGPGEPLPVRYEQGQIRVAWQMGGAGMLRILESWAPGWRATVNGRAAPVHRADFLFMAVPVPDAPCEVVLEYRPESVRNGTILTAIGLIAFAYCFAGGSTMRVKPKVAVRAR